MATQIGQASILLTADTASFETNMANARDTANGTFGDIRQQAADMQQQFAKGFAVATAAVGALSATVGVLVKDQMELVSALGRTAQLANTTAVEIQKYTFAAKAMGVEQDKLGDIFKDTQDKVGDFLTTEGGELKDFFDNIAPRVGVTTEKLREMSGPDALQAIYNGLEKANIGQAEMVFYMESIADEASLLIPLLKNNGEGFKIWEEAARNAGAVMDEKTIKATQELNASAKLLNLSWQGAKNQFTQAVIPALSDMAGKLIGNSTAADTARVAGERFVGGLKILAKVGIGVGTVFQVVGEAIGGFSASVATFFGALDTSDPLSFIMSLGKANTAAAHVFDDMMDGIDKRLQSAASAMSDIDRLGTGATNATVAKMMAIDAEQEEIRKLGITGAEQAQAREAAKEAAKEKEKAKKEQEKSAKASANKPYKGKVTPTTLDDGTPLAVAVYNGYRKAGLTPNQALAITAEVGRENNFQASVIFGTHSDPAKSKNGKTIRNVGMLSWNQGRDKRAVNFLTHAGVMNRDGTMQRTQANIDAQAAFSVQEMMSGDYKGKLHNFWTNPNADPESFSKELGKNYVVWAYGQDTIRGENGKRIPFDWRKHDRRRRNHLQDTKRLLQSGYGGVQGVKSSLQDMQKAEEELTRQLQKEADARLAIQKHYADEKTKAQTELAAREQDIKNAKFSPEDEAKYLKLAEAEYQNKVNLIDLAHDKLMQAATEHEQTDEERIINTAKLERRTVELTVSMAEDVRTASIEAINQKEMLALSALHLARDKAWQEVNEQYQTEEERIKARADLERREIMAIVKMDEALRTAKIKAVTDRELRAIQDLKDAYQNELTAINDYQFTELQRLRNSHADQHLAIFSNTRYNADQKQELADALSARQEHEINELHKKANQEKSAFYAEMGGVSELHGIETQHQARLDMIKGFLDSEVMTVEEAEKAKQLIRTQYAQDMLGSLAASSKAAFGEQSRAYQVMFAMQKGVAITQASLALWQNVSQAMAKGFPANVPLIAQAMAQGMGIIANIKAIKNTVVGQAHDGIMSVPKSGTWNLEKGERVLPKHTAQNLDRTLANLQDKRQGETKIIINNYTGEKTDVQQMPNGDFMVTIGKMMQQVARHELAEHHRRSKRQGWDR
ncbi:hypothetical protein [Moraxella sp. VT-16-12]|uniref:hypothetical protein n=1 Tax=Moraxella sp. VT-16-12 TaxID=2014877 RepID=UPI0011B54270|nr:hypothetical protein [Moraxella sp. VT-16-12]TWV80417.1 hypothetical protein CEW93_010035 [Moraxella sp. VT-16-12]